MPVKRPQQMKQPGKVKLFTGYSNGRRYDAAQNDTRQKFSRIIEGYIGGLSHAEMVGVLPHDYGKEVERSHQFDVSIWMECGHVIGQSASKAKPVNTKERKSRSGWCFKQSTGSSEGLLVLWDLTKFSKSNVFVRNHMIGIVETWVGQSVQSIMVNVSSPYELEGK
ncbi:hypothetical protein VNO78_32717 [Psophocarpus tetragonolobus]|uniref:Uncharacterized protein n=1 Tax=Psophocarpus tetragonolobus TaxID=3891 RepID=A0AAN9P145_PSOTE